MINTVHPIDCMKYMATCEDNQFDLAICDPPYGLPEHGGKNRSGFVKQRNGSIKFVQDGNYKKKNWGLNLPEEIYFDELFRISKNHVIWGVNYFFDKRLQGGRIVWNKHNGNATFSNCELAFSSFHRTVKIFDYMWSGMFQGKSILEGHIQQGNKKLNEKRIHPTQKPVALYKWLLKNYAKPGQTIFDSHVGSGSIRIACHDMGFDFTGCEIDKDYYEAQEKRYQKHIGQGDLFEAKEIQKLVYNKSPLD